MAAPTEKPVNTSPRGRPNKLIYARTSVLCNGQISWKVGGCTDMEYTATDPQRAELKSVDDATDDLNALNGLQIYRAKPLAPLEVKQPLRHAQSSLPRAVRSRIYTGDLYGSEGGVFSCPAEELGNKIGTVFGNERRADGQLNYNDFFRRLRRSEWLLWDVEAEKGHWVAVIAHLYKRPIRNPNKKHFHENPDIPAIVRSDDFNRIDEWCVVTAEHSSKAEAMANRVKDRLTAVLKEGRVGFDRDSEIETDIWFPKDQSNWSSGLHIYNLIKTLMGRITEFYCREVPYDMSFWGPLPGWVNVDEVRAEMQGRAAQRCLAATGYRSRIAIEGVRRWIGLKEQVRANELRPRQADNTAYRTGVLGQDGYCVPVGSSAPSSENSPLPGDNNKNKDNNDDNEDNENDDSNKKNNNNHTKNNNSHNGGKKKNEKNQGFDDSYVDIRGGPIGPPPSHVDGWDSEHAFPNGKPKLRHIPLGMMQRIKEKEAQLRRERALNEKKRIPIKPPVISGPLSSARPPSTRTLKKPLMLPVSKNDSSMLHSLTRPTMLPVPKNNISPWHTNTNTKKRKVGEFDDIKRDIEAAGGIQALVAKRLKQWKADQRKAEVKPPATTTDKPPVTPPGADVVRDVDKADRARARVKERLEKMKSTKAIPQLKF
ncbi:hypothetical protein F4678DRAFT_43887 [Xylaria arbuscula]|nr:hypothetical protein F4678DRAFT_43887 [Xylaria arbuscula]